MAPDISIFNYILPKETSIVTLNFIPQKKEQWIASFDCPFRCTLRATKIICKANGKGLNTYCSLEVHTYI